MKDTLIFDIQRFSLHDGPGIRTTVFLKGCPLQCVWCHNPESQSFEKETMVAQEKGNKKIVGYTKSISEIIKELEKDKEYYKKEGGLTVSGGEPMAHYEFTKRLLIEAKKRDIHTCVDTAGYASKKEFKEILPFVDIFLYDFKITDPAKHKKLTGVDNKLILRNLKFLHDYGAYIILRCPLIPGINDDLEHLQGIANLYKRLPGIKKIQIMAYHNAGKSKYKHLGKEYKLINLQSASSNKIEEWINRLIELGCRNVE